MSRPREDYDVAGVEADRRRKMKRRRKGCPRYLRARRGERWKKRRDGPWAASTVPPVTSPVTSGDEEA